MLSLNLSASSAMSEVIPDNLAPFSTISPMALLPSDISGAALSQDFPRAAAPNAARLCGSSMLAKISDNCLNASSGSFAVIPSALNFSPSLPMFTDSLLSDFAIPSRSPPDCCAANFKPAKSSTAMPVVLLKSRMLSAASIAPSIIRTKPTAPIPTAAPIAKKALFANSADRAAASCLALTASSCAR